VSALKTRKVEHHIKEEGEQTGSPLPNLCDLCGKMYELIKLDITGIQIIENL